MQYNMIKNDDQWSSALYINKFFCLHLANANYFCLEERLILGERLNDPDIYGASCSIAKDAVYREKCATSRFDSRWIR